MVHPADAAFVKPRPHLPIRVRVHGSLIVTHALLKMRQPRIRLSTKNEVAPMTRQRSKNPHAQRTYGVLVGRVVDGKMSFKGRSPHYEIWIKGGGADFRIAVNVRSVDGSDVLAYFDPGYVSPAKLDLPALAANVAGFKPLTTGPDGEGLDYLRGGLFPVEKMRPVPADDGGDPNGFDLCQMLDELMQRAKADPDALVIAFGEYFQNGGQDDYFLFSPERGVHDIHMMQGNGGSFADDNRINGDGALFVRFGASETAALFVRFSSQATETDYTGAAR